MKRAAYTGLFVGLALVTGLVAYAGADDVLLAMATVGWGIVPVCLARAPVLLADTLSWHVLLRGSDARPFARIFQIRYIADSINTLLPVARIGGELVRARLLARAGVAGARAGASVVVDLTAGVATQLLFTIVGIAALALLVGGAPETVLWLLAGLGLFAAGLAGFFLVQRRGLFLWLAQRMERLLAGRHWGSLTGDAETLDAHVRQQYAARSDVALCGLWRIVGWLAGTIEVWLILMLIGHPVSLAEAFVLESLGQAARSAGFMIPAGLGAQEGGLLLVGAQLGVTPELVLGLSLLKRVRELLIGVPGLILWQLEEGRVLWQRRGG